ncbi:MAG TPA: hypothetical protein VNK52_11855 [Hyphomicrobiaceae bacterium]|nr:hypothetical protein [Hyphomicrobiaceae bacterium]
MANEPDGGRDNLDVIRELLRRLEEAAHSRTLASPEPNSNRELASLQQRSPPTRLSPSPPPGERGLYPSLQALPVDSLARWRLPIVAVGAYALGVVTTVGTIAYYDRVARFAADLWGSPRPAAEEKVAMNEGPGARKEAGGIARDASDRGAGADRALTSSPAAVRAEAGGPSPTPGAQQQPAANSPVRSDAQGMASEPAVPAGSTATAPAPAPSPPQLQAKPKAYSSQTSQPAATTTSVSTGATDAGTAAIASTPSPPSQIKLKLAARVDAKSGQRTTLPVELDPMPTDSDALLLVMRGVPDEIALSQGSAIGNEIWLIPAHMSRDIEFTIAEAVTGTFDVTAELVTLDGRLMSQARTRIVASPTLVAAPAASEPTAPEKLDADALRRLTARGELLLDTGDISAARIVLERAAEAGSAIAALRLGETYDPAYLRRSGASAEAGDEAQALRWYERAQRLGSPGAAERLSELRKR